MHTLTEVHRQRPSVLLRELARKRGCPFAREKGFQIFLVTKDVLPVFLEADALTFGLVGLVVLLLAGARAVCRVGECANTSSKGSKR